MRTSLFLVLFILIRPNLCSQQKNSFLEFSTGIKNMQLIDYNTSPLNYQGNLFSASLAHTDISDKRQSTFRISGVLGNLFNETNNQNSTSNFKSLAIDYKELYQINGLSTNRVHIKIGGYINTFMNQRENKALLNSSKGIEVFSTLFANLKTTFLMNHKKITSNKIVFDFNYGLVNVSYRNGFAYINQSPILNDENFFEDYSFRFFSGLRIQSNLAYLWQLKTSNAIKLAYRWDVLKTADKTINYQIASHHLALTFYFKLK